MAPTAVTRAIVAAFCMLFPVACPSATTASEPTGFYGGIGAGQSSYRIGAADLFSLVKNNDNPARGFYWETTAARVTSNQDTGYQMHLGYRIARHVSLEGGYQDFGKMSFSANQEFICPVCSYPASGGPKRQVSGTIHASGVELHAVGNVPLGDRWSLLGRLGVIAARVSTMAATEDLNVFGVPFATRLQATQSTRSPVFGLGLEWALSADTTLAPVTTRLEWTRYRSLGTAATGESDVDVISLGVVLKF